MRAGSRRKKSSTWVEFSVGKAAIGSPHEKHAEPGEWWTAGDRGRPQELGLVGRSQDSSYSPARNYTDF